MTQAEGTPRTDGTSAALRAAAAADLPPVLGLLAAAALPTAGIPASLAGFVVAEQAGRLVGVAGVERYGTAGLLRSVAVDPSARGTGVGRALVERALGDARRNGVAEAYLLTTTAERYFPRLGFEPISREEVSPGVLASAEFQGVCPTSAVVMRRRLGAAPERGALRVLILCTGNSARSQMAEALLNLRAAGRIVAESAGSRPAAQVNPSAVAALAEVGIPWDGHEPRGLDGLDGAHWDIVITVCDRAREVCPLFPSLPAIAHWGMPDPAEVEGTEEEKRRAFRNALQVIGRRVDLLLALPLEKLERFALESSLRAIGSTPNPSAASAAS